MVIVLSGPSGVGKDSVLEEFTRQCPQVTRCVTVTTRPPRNNEQQGVDYHFVSVDKFRQMVDEGQFLEFAEAHGTFTALETLGTEQMAAGRDSILKSTYGRYLGEKPDT